jgi:hypothetical protein
LKSLNRVLCGAATFLPVDLNFGKRESLVLIAHSPFVYYLNLHFYLRVHLTRSSLVWNILICCLWDHHSLWPNVESNVFLVRMMLWGLNTCRYLATCKVRVLVPFRYWPSFIEEVLKHHLRRVGRQLFFVIFCGLWKLPSRSDLPDLIDVNILIEEFSWLLLTHLRCCHA